MARIILSEIQDFLLQRITTHEALRTISWLFDHADRSVTTAELAEELGLPKPTAQEALDDLVDADLVCIEEAVALRYRYQTKGPELHRDLERALTFAEQDKGEVARMLSANSIHRLRGMAYVAFAPALVKVSPTAVRERSVADSAGEPQAEPPITSAATTDTGSRLP